MKHQWQAVLYEHCSAGTEICSKLSHVLDGLCPQAASWPTHTRS